ncbi:MAG: metal ABC transporter permease, partial [Paracoccaceae bacterium]
MTEQKKFERKSAMRTIKRVVPYLWPTDYPGIKLRVVLAMIALVMARVTSVLTPFFFKGAIDSMSPDLLMDPTVMLVTGTVGLVLAYGTFRLFSVGFNQLRDAIFSKVGQRALRALALETF